MVEFHWSNYAGTFPIPASHIPIGPPEHRFWVQVRGQRVEVSIDEFGRFVEPIFDQANAPDMAAIPEEHVSDERVAELLEASGIDVPKTSDPMENLHRTFRGTKAFRPAAGVHGKELRKLRRAAKKELGL